MLDVNKFQVKFAAKCNTAVHPCSQQYYSQYLKVVEATQVSIIRWMDRMWSIHAMQCYSALKRREVMTHGTIWMNLKDILNARRQS